MRKGASTFPSRVPLPAKLPGGRTYYWRAKGDDGANTSGWSTTWTFEALPPVVFGAPEPKEPTANMRVASSTPEFAIANAAASGPFGNLWYHFQVSERSDFQTIFTNAEIDAGPGGETRYTMPPLLCPVAPSQQPRSAPGTRQSS